MNPAGPDTESQVPKLPGFGVPVNTSRSSACWKGRANGLETTVFPKSRERTIPAIVNEIYDKSEWDRKVNDEAIVAKWKTEALGK
ncbi:hypothetical protein AAF712_008624 [Marasmius tenuissimus]|uniref:DUF4246 domain-containing protein n=1 Tax=Marasmius tenuissimus TaxID=585030 RepID=A0ABR2ZT43_9AGAR